MSGSKVGIVDVGIGNIASIRNMISKCGAHADVVNEPSNLYSYKKIILPGVGNFKTAITKLRDRGFDAELINIAQDRNIQILGICLGMQLLCRFSEEGNVAGLGIVSADVKKISFKQPSSEKIPHMGWNAVTPEKKSKLFDNSQVDERFYFVHSFKVVPDDVNIIAGTTEYGGKFCAAFECQNIFGVQFHPEKSHKFGICLFNRFLEG